MMKVGSPDRDPIDQAGVLDQHSADVTLHGRQGHPVDASVRVSPRYRQRWSADTTAGVEDAVAIPDAGPRGEDASRAGGFLGSVTGGLRQSSLQRRAEPVDERLRPAIVEPLRPIALCRGVDVAQKATGT
jgi:hypothetical protein